MVFTINPACTSGRGPRHPRNTAESASDRDDILATATAISLSAALRAVGVGGSQSAKWTADLIPRFQQLKTRSPPLIDWRASPPSVALLRAV
jgi:hypothetical protein